MRSSRPKLALAFVAGLLTFSVRSAGPDYDPKPFEQALAPFWHKRLAAAAGLGSLSDLPLYQMNVHLRPLSSEILVELEINYRNLTGAPLKELVLRLPANAENISPKPLLSLREVKTNGIPAASAQPHPTLLRVELDPALPAGQRLLLSLVCRTRIPPLPEGGAEELFSDLTGGEGRAGYGILGQSQEVYNLALFYPLLASRSGGAWDESLPARLGDQINYDPANFLVRLRLPRPMRVAFTGVQLGEQPLGSGEAAERELYLMATAVRHFALQASSRYLEKEKIAGGVRLRALVLEDDHGLADKLLREAEKIIGRFSAWLGVYPYTAFQVAEAPLAGGAGGMEFPGMVTIASQLLHPQVAGPTGALLALMLGHAQAVEFVLAHETAHQWFHALVGSDSRRHPFLDEAPANYLAVMYMEKTYGSAAAENQMGLHLLSPLWLWQLLGGVGDGVVDRPTDAFASQMEYAALVYGKGALFFHKLRLLMGKQAFLECLRQVCSRHAFRRLTPDGLKSELALCHPQAASLFERWLRRLHLREDLAALGLDVEAGMERLLGALGSLQGFHNVRFDGALPAGTLRLFEEAVRQLSGGP